MNIITTLSLKTLSPKIVQFWPEELQKLDRKVQIAVLNDAIQLFQEIVDGISHPHIIN